MKTFRRSPVRLRVALALAGLAVSALPAAGVLAADFPTHAIRIIVPTAPGGASDLVTRLLAQAAGPILGQPIVVENRDGANGNTGMDYVLKSPPDGYTLGTCAIGNCSVNPFIYRAMPYDIDKEMQPVFWITSLTNVLVVRSETPAKNLADFIKLAKSQEFAYSSSGFGSAHQMSSELMAREIGAKFLNVPYRGAGPAQVGLLSGGVDFMVENVSGVLGNIRGGKLRGLAVTSETRVSNLPEIPTFAELGYKGVVVMPWFGFATAKGVPPAVLAKLNDAFNQALNSPLVQARFKELDLQPEGGSPQRFADHIHSEMERWHAVVVSAGIKAQ